MCKLTDYTKPQLIDVRGWVRRPIAIYVAGTQKGGPLSKYKFYLVFETADTAERVYTIPGDVEGDEDTTCTNMDRALQPNYDGVIRLGATPVHPRKGALKLHAWAPVYSGLPDFEARCPYFSGSGTLMFRVDYEVNMGFVQLPNVTTATAVPTTTTEFEGSEKGEEQSFEADGKILGVGVAYSGKGIKKSVSSKSTTGAVDTKAKQTGTITTVPVEHVKKVTIKSIGVPPQM